MPIDPHSSLKAVMDALVPIEQSVGADLSFPIYVYRWRPDGIPDFPAIYNWLGPSPFDRRTVAHGRDTLIVNARVAIRWADAQTRADQLEILVDEFRNKVDPALERSAPLGDLVREAHRQGMSNVADDFNEVPVIAVQFPLEFKLDRIVTP